MVFCSKINVSIWASIWMMFSANVHVGSESRPNRVLFSEIPGKLHPQPVWQSLNRSDTRPRYAAVPTGLEQYPFEKIPFVGIYRLHSPIDLKRAD